MNRREFLAASVVPLLPILPKKKNNLPIVKFRNKIVANLNYLLSVAKEADLNEVYKVKVWVDEKDSIQSRIWRFWGELFLYIRLENDKISVYWFATTPKNTFRSKGKGVNYHACYQRQVHSILGRKNEE